MFRNKLFQQLRATLAQSEIKPYHLVAYLQSLLQQLRCRTLFQESVLILGIEQIAGNVIVADAKSVMQHGLVKQHLYIVALHVPVAKLIALARLLLHQHTAVVRYKVHTALQAQCLAHERCFQQDVLHVQRLVVPHCLLQNLPDIGQLALRLGMETRELVFYRKNLKHVHVHETPCGSGISFFFLHGGSLPADFLIEQLAGKVTEQSGGRSLLAAQAVCQVGVWRNSICLETGGNGGNVNQIIRFQNYYLGMKNSFPRDAVQQAQLCADVQQGLQMCPTAQMAVVIHIINGYLFFKTILWNCLDEMVVPRKHAHPHLLHLWHGIRSFRPLGLGGEHREKFIRSGGVMYLTHQFGQTGGIMGQQHGQFLTGVLMQVVATATKVVYGIMKRTFYQIVLARKSQSGKWATEVDACM